MMDEDTGRSAFLEIKVLDCSFDTDADYYVMRFIGWFVSCFSPVVFKRYKTLLFLEKQDNSLSAY